MTDLTVHLGEPQQHSSRPRSALYHFVFATVFLFGFSAAAVTKLFGRTTIHGITATARQAAHATAGYAVRY